MSDRGDIRIRELERLARQGDDAAWTALQTELARTGEVVNYGLWERLVNDIWTQQLRYPDPTTIAYSGALLHNGETSYVISPDYLKTHKDQIQRLILVCPGPTVIKRMILIALLADRDNLLVFMKNVTSMAPLRQTSYTKGRRLQVIDGDGIILGGLVATSKIPTDADIITMYQGRHGR
jgi:hypothetical protein